MCMSSPTGILPVFSTSFWNFPPIQKLSPRRFRFCRFLPRGQHCSIFLFVLSNPLFPDHNGQAAHEYHKRSTCRDRPPK